MWVLFGCSMAMSMKTNYFMEKKKNSFDAIKNIIGLTGIRERKLSPRC